MTKDELQRALECAERCRDIDGMYWWGDVVDSLKATLEAKDEPVAWRTYTGRGYYIIDKTLEEAERNWPDKPHTPLYTTPPQRKPLTDEEMWNLWNSQGSDDMTQKEAIAFARAIEAAHGITGDNNG
jgi:hypothetical protein